MDYLQELHPFACGICPPLVRCLGIRFALAPVLGSAIDMSHMPLNLALPVADLANPSKASAPLFSPLLN
jgi:F420-0:gamma-glutamyl ligase-like protein